MNNINKKMWIIVSIVLVVAIFAALFLFLRSRLSVVIPDQGTAAGQNVIEIQEYYIGDEFRRDSVSDF